MAETTTPSAANNHIPMPNPTRDELDDNRFKAIYRAIKDWDIGVPNSYGGYCGATGSHAVVILRALDLSTAVEG